eukprot:CAMPEP_0202490678 /NCGR_PEP_ID=MMETSP1361-20130828/8010_1 /ASSEMBLY_ACC=CAM_ASM_000849 /TAXON_ID=210615 /ORGANISM="Staurosira complex sp., Strain CCMP2646" /LENGTH=641 /DNA_ID=CAMNT_0049120615 /DNA_START=131 /DNA_END=2056 /DNA_ORIENTATION=+
MTLQRLPALYDEAYHQKLNYKELGYSKLKSFLKTIPLIELETVGVNTLILLAQKNKRTASANSNQSTICVDLATVQSRVVQLVHLHSGPLDVCKLPALYRDSYYSNLDYKSLGFSKLKSFLESTQAIKLKTAVDGSILASVPRNKGTATVETNRTKPGMATPTKLWQVQSRITLLVSHHSETLTVCNLSALFEETYRVKLDFKGLGFAKLTRLLEAIPSIEVRKSNGGHPMHLVLCENRDKTHDATKLSVDLSSHVSGPRSEYANKRYGCPDCGELQNKLALCLNHIKECCSELLNVKKGLQQRCMLEHKTCIEPRQNMTAAARPLHGAPDPRLEIPKAFASFYEWAESREDKSDEDKEDETDGMLDAASVLMSKDLANDDNDNYAKEWTGETENENDDTASEDLVHDNDITESGERKVGESSRLWRVQSRVAFLIGRQSTPMNFNRVSSRYQEVFHEKLDFKEFGYSKLKLFLDDIPLVQVTKATKGALVVKLREKRTGEVMHETAHDPHDESLSSDVLNEFVENKDKCENMRPLGDGLSGDDIVSVTPETVADEGTSHAVADGVNLVESRIRELVVRHSPLDIAKMPKLYELTFHEKLNHSLDVKHSEFLMNIPLVAIGISKDMSTYLAYSTEHLLRGE